MNKEAITKYQDFVSVDGNHIVTDTTKVAKHFSRTHRYVMKKVRALVDQTKDEGMQLFLHTLTVNDQNGKTYVSYRLTKNGFMLLVMGFTGQAALKIKLAFIRAFEAMARIIRSGAWNEYNAAAVKLESETRYASACGSGLAKFRYKKPELVSRVEELKSKIQPLLFPEWEHRTISA